jgi:integrase/recombinase XerD
MNALRQRMIEDLRIRNYSPKTVSVYVRHVASFAKHFGRSPDRLGAEQVRAYQSYLVETKKASWSAFNQAVCALRFFYRTTLKRPDFVKHIPYPRQPKRLPVVLSVEDVSTVLNAVINVKHRTVLMTMYGTGVRLSEALALRVEDVDGHRMQLRVRQGKGKKERYVDLPPTLLDALRTYWKQDRPSGWLFPGQEPGRPLGPSAVQKALYVTRLKSGVRKPVTSHTLRHCFATHMLEAGVNLRVIQVLLGHSSLNTTARYLHVASRAMQSKEKIVDLLQVTRKTKRRR